MAVVSKFTSMNKYLEYKISEQQNMIFQAGVLSFGLTGRLFSSTIKETIDPKGTIREKNIIKVNKKRKYDAYSCRLL